MPPSGVQGQKVGKIQRSKTSPGQEDQRQLQGGSAPVVVAGQSLSRVQLCNPMDLQPARLLCPWDSLGKNTAVGCHFLLQGVFQSHKLNRGLLSCRQILYQLNYKGSPLHR